MEREKGLEPPKKKIKTDCIDLRCYERLDFEEIKKAVGVNHGGRGHQEEEEAVCRDEMFAGGAPGAPRCLHGEASE